ncbi:MAG: hypothetical protein K2H13_01220 [Eubacterium sp.]|nr:hypothetical protein [Eubacterium sp.]MDE6155229.1 hypothetical protein [Eubacterium sp.]MDE6767909.1 hypothetical protein [Eubacterium sp.]
MKNLSKVKKIIIAVVSVILVLIIAGGVYCIVTDQNPAQATKSIFTASDNQIIGKWQSQKNPGLSAYIFYEDGTYDSYISTANFSGNYEVDGNKLILKNPSTAKEITYKFSVNEKELSLTVIDDAIATDEKEVSKYDRVDELNQKSFADIIGELKENKETTTEKK